MEDFRARKQYYSLMGKDQSMQRTSRLMPDSIMYQEDAYVVLQPGKPEEFLSPAELLEKLKGILSAQTDLPRELQKFDSLEAQAKHLMETSCEFDVAPGQYIQWYVVRLEK
jgi:hypothetical protein